MELRNIKLKATRSDGQIFEYQNDDWIITSLDGLDFPPVEIFRSNRGYGNGSIITGKRKTERNIDIVTHGQSWHTNVADRIQAIAFHNNNYTFDLEVTYMGTTRVAKNCELDGAKCPFDNMYLPLELTVSFLSPECDLFANNEDQATFTSTTALWHDTRVYTQNGTLAFGVIEKSSEKVINYLGSETAPIIITITATGYVENVIATLNGIQVKIKEELTEGDVLVIDAEERVIKLNGQNWEPPSGAYGEIAYMNLPKFQLGYGDNVLSLTDGSGDFTGFEAEVSYTGRYGGL